MVTRRLEEDFQRMGLSEREAGKALSFLKEDTDVDSEEEETEEDSFEDDAYLSDLMGEDDEEDDELDDDDAMIERIVRLHKGSAKQRRAAKAYYRKNKSKIRRAMGKKRKTGAYKRRQKKLSKMSKGSGRSRRVIEGEMEENQILDDLALLAESMGDEPTSRFDEYVEAFNHIADLGEMAAMQIMEEDEEAALELLELSLKAEAVLQDMENMGGALLEDEDDMLESSLADAMDEVGEMFENHGFLEESDEDEDVDEDEDWDEDWDEDEDEEMDEEENPFFDMADELREARGKKKVVRPAKRKSRKVLNPDSVKTKRGPSAWGKLHGPGASKKQLAGRKDVRNKQALLAYLAQVKAGRVAPGQPLKSAKGMGKSKGKAKGKARKSA